MDDTGHRGPPEPLDQSPSPPAAPHADKPYRERRRLDQLRSAIHDRLGPGLANLQLRLELLEEATGGTGAIGEQIAHLRSEATDLVRELARIVHDEPPEVVEREGLLKAVDAACRREPRCPFGPETNSGTGPLTGAAWNSRPKNIRSMNSGTKDPRTSISRRYPLTMFVRRLKRKTQER